MSPPELRFFVSGMAIAQGSKSAFSIRRKNASGAWEYTGKTALVESGNKTRKDALKHWRQAIAIEANNAKVAAGWPVLDVPIEVVATFYLPRPKKPQFHVPATGYDLDKLQRGLGDSITNILLCNDARIVHWNVWKLYADREHAPGVDVMVRRFQAPVGATLKLQ